MTFITWNDAVNDQETCAANMIGDQFQRIVIQICSRLCRAAALIRFWKVSISVVGNEHAAKQRQYVPPIPVSTHGFGNDAIHLCSSLLNCSMKIEVPHFDETITVFIRRNLGGPPQISAVIIENFTARTARTSIRHLPEVVRCVARTLLSPMRMMRSTGTIQSIFPNIVSLSSSW